MTNHFSLWPTILMPQQKKLNKELNKTNNWACKRKMNFNPDQSKLAQEVLFSGKLQKVSHPSCF